MTDFQWNIIMLNDMIEWSLYTGFDKSFCFKRMNVYLERINEATPLASRWDWYDEHAFYMLDLYVEGMTPIMKVLAGYISRDSGWRW